MNAPHGNFTITVEGRIVRPHVNSAFNFEGTAVFFDEVIKHAEGLDAWVLYTHLGPNTGVTPDTLEYSTQRLNELANVGCVGIAVFVESKLNTYLIKEVHKSCAIINFVSEDAHEIDDFIKEVLAPYTNK